MKAVNLAAALTCSCFVASPAASSSNSLQVAQAYAIALQTHDFERFRALFEESRYRFLSQQDFAKISTNLGKIWLFHETGDTPGIRFEFSHLDHRSTFTRTGSLYVTPAGKIKYDPVFFGHPAFGIRGTIAQLESDDQRVRRVTIESLMRWRIPSFDFEAEAPRSERERAISAMRQWWADNRETFDWSDPHMPMTLGDLRRENERSAQQSDAPNRRPALQYRVPHVVPAPDSQPGPVSGGGR